MEQNIKKLADTIKSETITKDKTSFVFIGYLILLEYKGRLLSQGIRQSDIYKYLSIPIQTTKSEYDNADSFQPIINLIDYRLMEYKYQSKKLYNRVKENWDMLGLKTIREEFQNNPQGMIKILLQFNHIEVNIQSMMELYELLNPTDKKLNDFFTPMNVAQGASALINDNTLEDKEEINIFDGACGIGRLFYSKFIELKNKYPNKIINIYGIDLCARFATFTHSMFSLINIDNTNIVIGNSLQSQPFQNIKMDIMLGNPPFDKKGYDIDTVLKILKYEDKFISKVKRDLREHPLSVVKHYQNTPIITQEEYLQLTNNFKRV